MCDLPNPIDFSIDLPNDYENWELGFGYKMGYAHPIWLFKLNAIYLSIFLLFPFFSIKVKGFHKIVMYMAINWWLQIYGREIYIYCRIHVHIMQIWLSLNCGQKFFLISKIQCRNYHFYRLSFLKLENIYLKERIGQRTNFGHSTI